MAQQKPASSKFALLRKLETAAPNYELTTDDIIGKLTEWDEKYGVEISEVKQDSVTVTFSRLSKNLAALAADIYDFCPDTIDQGFDNLPDMLAAEDMFEPELLEQMRALAEGIDFKQPDYGMELLKKSLKLDRSVGLWWD